MVAVQPRALVGEQPERGGVGLGEAEGGERQDLLEDQVRGRLVHAALGRAVPERVPVRGERLARSPATHRATQALRLPLREAGQRLGDVEHLILVDDHPEGVEKRLLEQWMVVGDLVGRVGPQRLAPCQVGVDGTSLDRPGAHQRDLDGEIVQRPGSRAQQHLHLRP